MTTLARPLPAPAVVRPVLLSRPLLLRFVSVAACSIGFYLPLSVLPRLAEQTGSRGDAGLATVALLVATVGCELATPRLVARVGYRWALALGLTLLGAPTAVLPWWNGLDAILAVSVVRGAGFAVAVVAGGAVTATLIPPERRGEGLALVGVVGGVPGMLALPAGVWAAATWGYSPVFWATTAATLPAVLTVLGLPRRTAAGAAAAATGVLAALRGPTLTRPAVVFAAVTSAVGVLVTFLPLATTGAPTWVAATALLLQPAAATASRWVAGRVGDRRGPSCLLVPGLALSALGMAGTAFTGVPWAVVGGAAVFGIGFGALQNATLSLMYARVPAGSEGTVSAIWNAAYDLGMAVGALAAGLVAARAGYPAAFLLAAAAVLPALWLVRRDRLSAPPAPPR